ncbi:MAG: hypothetical protein KF795_03135 [Labilithrix sp.]|nr:hypothetical protein [Labilithrix sp.]
MLVRLVTTIAIVIPILGARIVRGEGMPWIVVLIVAFLGFGTGRIVERFVVHGQTRQRRRAGWALMLGSSALACLYAVSGSVADLSAKIAEWTARDAGPPPPAPEWEHHEGKWLRVSVSASGACALRAEDSVVVCWGDPERGWPEKETVASGLGASIDEIAVTDRAVCARSANDRMVRCGPPAGEKRESARSTKPSGSLAAGATHACAIGADGGVTCWRDAEPDTAKRVEGIGGAAVQLAASGTQACARTATEVVCWTFEREAHAVDGLPSVTAIGVGPVKVCGVVGASRLVCVRPGPAEEVQGFSDVRSFAVGEDHLCAVQGRRVRCRGKNDHGQLARHDLADVGFHQVSGTELHDVGPIATGPYATCAIDFDGDGELVCWGMRVKRR